MRAKLVFFLLMLVIFSILMPQTNANNKVFAKNLVRYDGEIAHLFTHCLIAYPKIAFKNDNYMRRDYDRDCLTTSEFSKILNSLYKNNYILVKISDIYKVKDAIAYKNTLLLPKNKKPLVLSFDDVNYDTKKIGRGMVDKIILDDYGNLATYTNNAPDDKKIAYDKEFVNVLENFIEMHPDFSHNNARGLLCLTGYDGILGYRTDLIGANRQSEIKAARKVVNTLKAKGWEFASHSYGHYHMSKISDAIFTREIERWQNEVEPLIGKTQVYVYPYGEYEIANDQKQKTYKHKLLEKAGYKLFCGVGKKYFFGYAPFHIDKKDRVLFMDRHPVDGNNLRKNHKEYKKFFNSYEVYDHKNRTMPFYRE
jgi:peptidoglycan/xylan/chitin deacetylase (PgdA/CDA1 family)